LFPLGRHRTAIDEKTRKYRTEDHPSTKNQRVFQVREGKEEESREEKETAETTKKRRTMKVAAKRMYWSRVNTVDGLSC